MSIILPTYNRNYIVWKAIQSVLNQTYLNFELIIVDSGNDNTKKIVDQFLDPRIKYIRIKDKLNPSKARNIGIENAQGSYICYIDSDVVYYPEFIGYMLISLLANPKKVITYCAKNKVIVEYNSQDKIIERIEKIDCCTPINIKQLLLMEEYIDTNTIMHKKDILDIIGDWDEKCEKLEDWEFVLRVYKTFPEGFLHVPRVLVDYTQIKGLKSDGVHADSNSSASREYVKRKYYELFQLITPQYNSKLGWLK